MSNGGRTFERAETHLLRELRNHPAARFIAHAAVKAGRDPLTELGLTEAPLTVLSATLLFDLLMVKEEDELTETEADEAADEMLARMEREEAWDAATDPEQGYEGPRGLTPKASVRTLYPMPNPEEEVRPAEVQAWPERVTLPGYTLTFALTPPAPAP